jgi:hypothetical protein
MLGGALVAFCSMLIVMQDWDFPDFSGNDPCGITPSSRHGREAP